MRRARVCAALAVYVHGGRSRVWANGCSKTRLSDFPGTAEWGRTGCGPGRTSGCSAVAVCLLPVKDPLQRRAWPAEAPGTVHRNVVTCYATFRHVSVISQQIYGENKLTRAPMRKCRLEMSNESDDWSLSSALLIFWFVDIQVAFSVFCPMSPQFGESIHLWQILMPKYPGSLAVT